MSQFCIFLFKSDKVILFEMLDLAVTKLVEGGHENLLFVCRRLLLFNTTGCQNPSYAMCL